MGEVAQTDKTPLLLRAARGEKLERPPVWMMRQAGRYMKAYRDVREKYPSFRERSEIPEVAIEISLQPWKAFRPDGVIMFSDIVTPLPGLGIEMDIAEGKGPVISSPIRSQEQVDALHPLEPEESLPFIRTILESLCSEVNNEAAVLGFVGAPWTLAAYAVEGKGSKTYSNIKKMMFDSWAGQLCPQDYATFALPYQQQVFRKVKETHPNTPLILLVSGSAGLLEMMPASGADMISVDWTVDMADARKRLGKDISGQDMKVQGNIDPGVLFGSHEIIRDRILDTIRKAGNQGHILNLGHGVLVGTPEDNVRYFFETAKQADQLLALA